MKRKDPEDDQEPDTNALPTHATLPASLPSSGEMAKRQAQRENLKLLKAKNTTGYLGVRYREGECNPYKVSLQCDDRILHIGYYSSAEEAALARARKASGEKGKTSSQTCGLGMSPASSTKNPVKPRAATEGTAQSVRPSKKKPTPLTADAPRASGGGKSGGVSAGGVSAGGVSEQSPLAPTCESQAPSSNPDQQNTSCNGPKRSGRKLTTRERAARAKVNATKRLLGEIP